MKKVWSLVNELTAKTLVRLADAQVEMSLRSAHTYFVTAQMLSNIPLQHYDEISNNVVYMRSAKAQTSLRARAV